MVYSHRHRPHLHHLIFQASKIHLWHFHKFSENHPIHSLDSNSRFTLVSTWKPSVITNHSIVVWSSFHQTEWQEVPMPFFSSSLFHMLIKLLQSFRFSILLMRLARIQPPPFFVQWKLKQHLLSKCVVNYNKQQRLMPNMFSLQLVVPLQKF